MQTDRNVDPLLQQANEESYFTKLTAFLSANPPGSMAPVAPITTSFSSPESSGSSPSSSSGLSNGTGTNNNSYSTANTAALQQSNTIAPQNLSSNAHIDKRKAGEEELVIGSMKDRRDSGSESVGDGIHTHPDFEDDDQDGSPDDGTKKGKTSDRRRAQNRQAQRAFRERKEKHLKELEDRVFSLERASTAKESENGALKQLLERLQSENERLKVFESAFSFSYAKDVTTSDTMPTSMTFGGSPPKGIPSPPIATANDFSNFDLSAASFGLSAAPTTYNPTFSLPSSTAATSASTGHTPGYGDFFLTSLSAPSPSSTVDSSASPSSHQLTTPPDLGGLSSDPFASYRDVSTLSSGLDYTSQGGVTSFDPIFDESGLDLSSYLTSPSPPALVVEKQLPIRAPSGDNPLGMAAGVLDPCGGIVKPQKAYEFDLDGLCSDMRAKATCQEAARLALSAAMAEDALATSKRFPSSS